MKSKKKSLLVLALVVVFMLAIAGSVAAVTNGSPDGNDHPFVGLMVAQDEAGNPMWRCTGALISPDLFLTAGHCTEAPAAHVEIWFAEDVQSGIPDNGYPLMGDVGGTPYTHPDYNPAAFFLYDLGVVVLDEPMIMDAYGQLPDLGVLDNYKGKDKKAALLAVGYGLQEINPVRVVGQRVRLQAELDILNTRGVFGVPKDTSVAVSGSGVGGDASATGGTCFGDSGGPQFLNDDSNTIVAVTSFGMNGNCAGTGGGYRVDQPDDLTWLATFFE